MRSFVALGLLFLSLSIANANDAVVLALSQMRGTLNVSAEPYRSDGKLTGCSLVYTGLLQDWKYRKGRFLKVFGNIALMVSNGAIVHTLKVGVQVLDTDKPNLGTEFAAPSRIYLVGSDFSTTLNSMVETRQSDTPGATFAVFHPDPAFQVLMDGLQSNKVTVAFNSMNGASDIELPVELDVVDRKPSGEAVRSETAKAEFLQCLTALTDGRPN